MRITTLFRRLLAVIPLFITGVRFEEAGLILGVRPRWRKPRCGLCGTRGPGYDRLPPRRWRSLNLGAMKIFLEYRLRRVSCARCGIRAEEVPWAAHGNRFTDDFGELVAYLAQAMDQTAVSKFVGIAWRTVEGIVENVVFERLDPTRLDGLRHIGIDEFGYRKRHRYLTVIVDHMTHRVIWACEVRTIEALEGFFNQLGPERCALIETVTMDMAGAYKRAVKNHLRNAEIVYDRFHVQRMASDALDKVRRELWRELQGTDEGKTIKRTRFALLKNPWNLNLSEQQRLADVQKNNRKLYRAYLLKEALVDALDRIHPARAKKALKAWLVWAFRCRLKPFVRVARTIRRHFNGILAYFEWRLTNGLVEGINNHIRVIARRAYGYHSPGALIAMIYLCCGGIELSPPLPSPT